MLATADKVPYSDPVSIAIVLLTHNRLPLLQQCVENVVAKTSAETEELVIWDNGSSDGTTEYLRGLNDERIRLVCSETNVGMVAYGRAIAMTTAPYIVQLDDDVIDAPASWDAELRRAFEAIPRMGWLAADLEDNPDDRASCDRHHKDHYVERVLGGVAVLEGPTGGWCTITSRKIYDEVGGLPRRSRRTYFSTDSNYVNKLRKAGYVGAILPSVRVRHSGDPPGPPASPEKARFHRREDEWQRKKDLVKRALLRLPGVRTANERRAWFHAPGPSGRPRR